MYWYTEHRRMGKVHKLNFFCFFCTHKTQYIFCFVICLYICIANNLSNWWVCGGSLIQPIYERQKVRKTWKIKKSRGVLVCKNSVTYAPVKSIRLLLPADKTQPAAALNDFRLFADEIEFISFLFSPLPSTCYGIFAKTFIWFYSFMRIIYECLMRIAASLPSYTLLFLLPLIPLAI